MNIHDYSDISGNQNKTVLMGCTQPYWSALQVGSQHLARQFARNGWHVHYFSAPISLLHLPKLFNSEVIKRLKSSVHYPTIHEHGMIQSYVPFSLIAPDGRFLLRNKVVTHHWFKTMVPSFNHLQHKMGIGQTTILYIDNLSYHFLLDQLKYQKSIFRVMDMHDHFSGWEGKAFGLAQKIARQADVTVYSANGLKSYADTLGARRISFMPNGVDFDFFQVEQPAGQKHPMLQNIPGPIFLYTGMIDSRFDVRLIRSVAKTLPNVSFVFTGPFDIVGALNDMPANVYFTGPVPHDQLPWLMKSVKAGLIPFDVKNQRDLIQGIRPLKLFEYMASGLPVISARWPEIEKINSPAWLYDNETEFVAFVHKAIHNEYEPMSHLNFARQHDWNQSFKIMLKTIYS
ncbi:MAG: glycosyltransferase [Desulfobacteraceae bacterium]|jgi:glycosyltransferase involved in cell wall biosynthesis|nr:glycosyltransferase [Desulfobacteraceae bacterium]